MGSGGKGGEWREGLFSRELLNIQVVKQKVRVVIRRQGREAERKQAEGRSGEIRVGVNDFEVYLEVRELFEELVEVLEEEEKEKEKEKEQRDKSGMGKWGAWGIGVRGEGICRCSFFFFPFACGKYASSG